MEPADLPPDRFIDRELSWLAFNQRVLELAEDPEVPLLERAKFLAIFSSNLDEFFMVRVAGLRRRMATGIAVRAASGLMPREVLDAVLKRSHELMIREAHCLRREVLPALVSEGIELVRWGDLGEMERKELSALFDQHVCPVLTPLAVDPAHPFPYISGLSLSLAVVLRNPVTGESHFARVKVPETMRRFVEAGPDQYVPLEDVIAAHLDRLFPGMLIEQHHTFRVTRNEDLEVEEDDAENLLQALERELMRRRFGPPVRLEVEESIDPDVLELLIRELEISSAEVFRLPGPLDLTGLSTLVRIDRDDLKDPAFIPKTKHELAGVETAVAPDVLEAIRRADVLLHHPYDSFATSVQRFLEQAAADPRVVAIKQTLYRTSGDSPIVDALIDAAEAGKQVMVLVEIKARFDEQANISWARKLERAGVHVVYGLVGLKTHCKLSMVIREEGDELRRYCHVGTGNYHSKTARLYEDLGLLTCDPVVGSDVSNLFNRLSGYSLSTDYDRLLVAPHSIRTGLVARIEREARNHENGLPSRIRFKANALVDEACIDALYRASQAGVPIELWIRGTCALRPGVPGLSDTIKVRCVLGRFLEHSRIYEFANGGEEPDVFIGSADLMHRNLDRRVETLVRITNGDQVAELSALLDLGMADTSASWHLDMDGNWERREYGPSGERLVDTQAALISLRQQRGKTGS